MNLKKSLRNAAFSSIATLGIAAFFVSPVLAADMTELVLPSSLESNQMNAVTNGKWFFYNDETDQVVPTLGSFVMGPATAPLGAGSVQMSVTGSERKNIATYRFKSTPLSDITTLKFSTYNPSEGNGGSANRSAYLQFNVSFNGSDTWQRRLTFVPKNNGSVLQNTWQEWDALAGGTARWTYSGSVWPGTVIAGQTPRTWSEILAAYPSAKLRTTDSFMGFRVGEPYADGYTGQVDAFQFGTADGVTTFNFDPQVGPPTEKDTCKNEGWMTFNTPTFKNQGQCVKYVEMALKATR